MSNKIKDAVDEIQFRTKMSQEDLAKKIGYTRPYLTKAINEGGSEKVYNKLKRAFPEILQNNTTEPTDRMIENNNSLSLSLLEKMIENTTKLVNTNALLVETNATQVRMIEQKILPGSADLQTQPAVSPIDPVILAKIIRGGMGKHWKTEAEADILLNKWITAPPAQTTASSSRYAERRKDK